MTKRYIEYLIKKAREGDRQAIEQLNRADIDYLLFEEEEPLESFDEVVARKTRPYVRRKPFVQHGTPVQGKL